MVWFTLALFVASFFLSALFAPRPQVEQARAGKLGDLNFPMADAGAPIPYVFGKVSLKGPNCIWYGNFKSYRNTERQHVRFAPDKDIFVSHSYSIGLQMALCLGPGVKLHKVSAGNGKVVYNSALGITGGTSVNINLPSLFGGVKQGGGIVGTMVFYDGSFSQTADSYLTTQLSPNVVPGYKGISYVLFRDHIFSSGAANLRPYYFLVSRYPDNLGLGSSRIIGDDLNPMEVLYSILTEDWGGVGRDASEINTASFTAAAAVLLTEGNGMSIKIESSTRVQDVVEEILRQVDGHLYQDSATGEITVSLIREDYTVASLPVFDKSNVKAIKKWSRTGWNETKNQIRLDFTDPLREYKKSSAFVQDHANISALNKVNTIEVSYPYVTDPALAVEIATRELSQLSIPLYRATLLANREAQALRPGSPFVLDFPERNINEVVFRVQRFDAGDLVNGRITMDVIQDQFAAANPLFGDTEATLWSPIDRAANDPDDINVFETPYWIVQKQNTFLPASYPDSSWLYAFVRPANEQHTQYDLVVSDDDFDRDVAVEIAGVSHPASALLVGGLPQEYGRETGVGAKIVVSDTLFNTALTGFWGPGSSWFRDVADVTEDIRTAGENLFVLNGEIMAYETFTDNGDGTYDLENVHRALIDTKYALHAAGDVVYFLTALHNWMSYSPRGDIDALKYKILEYTDADAQSFDDVTAVVFTNNQRYDRPAPPDFLQIESVRGPHEIIARTSLAVSWRERNRTDALLAFVNDATDTPESSTTYNARLYIDGNLIEEKTALGTTSTTFSTDVDGWGIARVEVEAVRGGLTSYTVEDSIFFYANYESLSSELLTNARFESGLTGWTQAAGTWSTENTSYPFEPFYDVDNSSDNTSAISTGSSNELRQDFTLTASELEKQGIVRIWRGIEDIASDTSQVIIELRDGGGVLDSITTTANAQDDFGEWELMEFPIPIRSDATILRVRLVAAGASKWAQTSFKVNTVGVTASFFYDDLSTITTIVGAWGLRQLISTYSGAIVRIRDTYDNSEQDVGADPDGNLDPFFTRLEARIVKIYDQSGNGNDLDSFATYDPRLRYMESETGRSASNHDVSPQGYRDINAPDGARDYQIARPNTVLVCGQKRSTTTSYVFSQPHDEPQTTPSGKSWPFLFSVLASTSWQFYLNGELETSGSWNGAPASGGKHVVFIDAQNGDIYHNDDVIAADTFTAADVDYDPDAGGAQSRLHVGIRDNGSSNFWDIDGFYELVIFDGTLDGTDRGTLFAGLSDYWFNEAY